MFTAHTKLLARRFVHAAKLVVYRPYSYCVMDDVIAISITELYGQPSGKRVVLCITKAVKCSSLVFGNNMFTYQVCCS